MQTLEEAGGVDGFVSPASFWFPEALLESAWHQHAPFAFWLMQMLRPRSFVELGTHHGFSYLCLCQAAERLQLDTRGYAVDTWQGDDHAGFYDGDVYARLRDLHDPRYGSFSRLVRSTFDDALPHFADKSIDLLHIDGRHFYDDVKHDFESWQAKLSDRAVVLFHDTNVYERGFGVFKFWQEVRSQCASFEFFHGHGLGVLGVGAELSARFKGFLKASAAPTHCARLRSTYSRLGSAIEDQYLLAGLKEKLRQSDEELVQLRQTAIATEQQLTQQIMRITDLEQLIEQRSAEATALRGELAIKDKDALGVKRDLAEQQAHAAAQIALIESELNEQRQQRELAERRLGERLRQSNSSRWLLKLLGGKIIHMPRDVSRRGRRSLAKRWNKQRTLPMIADHGPRSVHRVINDRHFRKYLSSRLVLHLKPILPRRFAERMYNRMAKNAILGTNLSSIDQHQHGILLGASKQIPANLKIVIGIVTYNNSEEQLNRVIKSALVALTRLGNAQNHCILVIDNGYKSKFNINEQIIRVPGKGNIGFGAAHNILMNEAFQIGAEVYICANPDGAFHPDSVRNLVQMGLAHDFNALIEALQFPDEHPKVYDHQTFDTPWVSGACLMIPKKIHRCIGGFDEDFFMYCEDVDISWRAQDAKFSVKTCPNAFFFHDYSERDGSDIKRFMLRSGYILAKKWGSKSFEYQMRTALAEINETVPLPIITPRQRRDSFVPDFDKRFHFATVRW
jgi:GT2 family glycosyltransferase